MHPSFIATDPLHKIFKDSSLPPDGYTADAVRGEEAAIQLVFIPVKRMTVTLLHPVALYNGTAKLEGAMRFVGFVPVAKNTPDTPPEELIASAPRLFPDPLCEEESLRLAPGECCPIWLTIRVGDDAAPGVYRGEACVLADGEKAACPITLTVHRARLSSERHLAATTWFFADKVASHYGMAPWSEEHWRYIGSVAEDMATHRQNAIFTPLWDLVDLYREEGALRADFNRFDRWVELFDRHGAADLIEGSHLGGREGGRWEAEHFTLCRVPIRRSDGSILEEVKSPRAGSGLFKAFLAEFLPLLRKHLAEKKWLDRYIQHIADEPTKETAASWKVFSACVKEHMPETRRVDATMTDIVEGALDIWVPLLDRYDARQDFYDVRKRAGETVWFYTCLIPRGKYPNRFIDLPLLKTRLLPWVNFRYGLTGQLHWGYNWWSKEPFLNVEPEQISGPPPLPPGDNAIVYPGKRGVLSSIRWEMLRKGLEDYELLHQLNRTQPVLAREIAAEALPTITTHLRQPDVFHALRRRMIDALDAAAPL